MIILQDGVTVTHCTSFNPETNSNELWEDLHSDGALQTNSGNVMHNEVKINIPRSNWDLFFSGYFDVMQ